MSETQKRQGSFIAIITMFFLYAMISFVTNLAAPIGVIWKNQPEIGGSNPQRRLLYTLQGNCQMLH